MKKIPFIGLSLVIILAIGGWLRWQFIHTVQLFPDEFVTLLAVRMIGETGLPTMPSGLFYEHGLLYSYLGSLTAFFGPPRLTVRYLSLLLGLITLLLTFFVGRRFFSSAVGLMTVTGLAVAPSAIEWSGRARMYVLVQLLVLLTLWLVYQGISQNKAWLRWVALAAYLCAMLAHFGAVAIAPPLALAALTLLWLKKQRFGNPFKSWHWWLEGVAFGGILLVAFVVKRAGQPKGINALDGSATSAITGIAEVLEIYSDVSFNVWGGWQAVSPFYLTLPAIIFVPFAVLVICLSGAVFARQLKKTVSPSRRLATGGQASYLKFLPSLYLSIILLFTTLEMIFLVSPHRRDEKYLFMLLPVLFLLGAQGMAVLGCWAGRRIGFSKESLLTNGLKILLPLLVSVIILWVTWPSVRNLLADTGDDYDAAFAYVQQHWQNGDTILTGTPAAAAFYLNRNDFYSVQRAGGYDYRILDRGGQAVDRWLASPAIRTEAALHQTLSSNTVWLVLERWGLQKEYFDLPFQQQLLAQTDYVSGAQGIFILRAKANPRPLADHPAQAVQAVFGDAVQLTGYTVEPNQGIPGQPLRLTLYWQALASMPHDYTVFVHVRQAEGGNVAQADHLPLGNIYPTSIWPVGETIRESSDLYLPPGLSVGKYELWAGLYLLETGERLPVQNDTSSENAVKLGSLSIVNDE